jgi:hypothetical protein
VEVRGAQPGRPKLYNIEQTIYWYADLCRAQFYSFFSTLQSDHRQRWASSVKHSDIARVMRLLSNRLLPFMKPPPYRPRLFCNNRQVHPQATSPLHLPAYYSPRPTRSEQSTFRITHSRISKKLSRGCGHRGSRLNHTRLQGIMNGN